MNEPAAEPNLTATVADVFGAEDEPTPEPTPTPVPDGGEPTGEPSGEPRTGEPTKPAAFPTPEQITASVREGLRQSHEAAPAAPREYSQAELDQMFNIYQPTPEIIQRLLAGGEDALKAFVEIRDGLGRQFGTLLQYQLELARRELVSHVDPALRFVAEAAAKADREDFFSQHEDLKDYELLTQTVFNALKAEGYQAPDKATAFKTLADRTRALLPTASGNGSGTTPSGGSRTKTSPTERRPASLSSGSQAGGGGGSAPQAPFPGAEVFL
jgi:hypothetical protein